ncbi:hypothetical protein Gotur_028406 [Gossypium turneri]
MRYQPIVGRRILFRCNNKSQTQTTRLGLTLMCSFHNPDSLSIGLMKLFWSRIIFEMHT